MWVCALIIKTLNIDNEMNRSNVYQIACRPWLWYIATSQQVASSQATGAPPPGERMARMFGRPGTSIYRDKSAFKWTTPFQPPVPTVGNANSAKLTFWRLELAQSATWCLHQRHRRPPARASLEPALLHPASGLYRIAANRLEHLLAAGLLINEH